MECGVSLYFALACDLSMALKKPLTVIQGLHEKIFNII